MRKAKLIGSMIVAVAMAISASPMVASAASNTAGLVAISVRGVGQGGGLGDRTGGNCLTPPIDCEAGHTCECLTGTESLVGSATYSRLTFALSIDVSDFSLEVFLMAPREDEAGFKCLPATGKGTLSNGNGKNTISLDISGLACPLTANAAATGAPLEGFNGTYVVTGGTAPGSQKPFTTGVGTFTTGVGADTGDVNDEAVYVSLEGWAQRAP
jgi:hypothetical protein